MGDNYKKQHNAKLIEILDEIVRVCETYGLRYYLGYGTVIGAVRHHGMIPWDDDIDILMPRKDYDTLYKIANEAFGKNFRLANFKRTKNYTYDFMKVEAMDTTLIERVNPVYVGGLFVDIFPLDNVPSVEKNRELIGKVKKRFSDYAKYYIDPEPNTIAIAKVWYAYKKWKFNIQRMLNEWDTLALKYGEAECEYRIDYHVDYMDRALFHKDVFGDGVKMMFEGKEYIVPQDYHTYLTQIYGDYMQFPPEEKRNSGHTYIFLDISHRLSDEELKPILASINKRYKYQFSPKREIKQLVGFAARMFRKD